MITLDKQQKEDLKLLIESRGFKVLDSIIKDFELDVLRSLKKVNLADEKQLKVLNAKQNYLLWIEDIQNLLKNQTNSISNRKFDK